MGDQLDLTLLIEKIGRSSLSLIIVGHHEGIERLRARTVTAMMSLASRRSVEMPISLRRAFEAYALKAAGR
jgi:4-hydroxybenzoyl-CoA thioesterase